MQDSQQITVNPKSIYKAKSDLRRNVMKEAILNKSKSIYEETEKGTGSIC